MDFFGGKCAISDIHNSNWDSQDFFPTFNTLLTTSLGVFLKNMIYIYLYNNGGFIIKSWMELLVH